MIGRFRQAADDPSADIAYVLHAGGHIGVVEFGEAANDLRNLRLNGGFGVSAVLFDALLDAPDKARAGQHLHVRVEEEAELFGNGRRQFPRLGSQGFDLIPCILDRGLKARDLAVDLFTLDAIFRHVEGTAFDNVGWPDRNARRDAHTVEEEFLAFAVRLSLHQIGCL